MPAEKGDDVVQMVQQGAAHAPGWTAAIFHELLDQESNPASAPALHHAAELMSLHDAAKAQHCMAGMAQTISGELKPWTLHDAAKAQH